MGTNASRPQRTVQPQVVSTPNTPSPAPARQSQPVSTTTSSSVQPSSSTGSYTPTVTYSAPVVITYSVTKTNYFNSVNLDQIYSVCMDILQKLRGYSLVYNLVGLWEAASANKLQKELNKMHTYLEYLCATLQGFTNVIEQGQKIKSLQSQVDSYCTDLTSYDNYVAANNLISQINSLMGNINPSLSAMQTQSVLPASVNETFTSPVATRYRFCYNAVLGVANQANSDRSAIVGYYQSFCNLESSVRGDSYINSGWNIVVQLFDKFIKKSDKIANWWTNYFANIRNLEQKLPDSEFVISETTTESYGRDHETFAIPSFDAYRTANQGESLNFNVPGRSSGTAGSSAGIGGGSYSVGTNASRTGGSTGTGIVPNGANRTSFTYGTNNSYRPNYAYTNASTGSSSGYTGIPGTVATNQSTGPNIPRGTSSMLNTTPSGPNFATNNGEQEVVRIVIRDPEPQTTTPIHAEDRDAFDQRVRDASRQAGIYCRLNDENQTELTREQFDRNVLDYNNAMRVMHNRYPNMADVVENGNISADALSEWASGELTNLNSSLEAQNNIIETETAAANSLQNNVLTRGADWQQTYADHIRNAEYAQRQADTIQATIANLSNIVDHGREMLICSSPGAYVVLNND